MKRNVLGMLLALVLVLMLSGCMSVLSASDTGAAAGQATAVGTVAGVAPKATATTAVKTKAVEDPMTDADETVGGSVVAIVLGNATTVDGAGVTIEGSSVKISAGGTYRISGTLADGQVIVDSADKETVRLILDGADITCSTSAPIYVLNAEKTIIALADGSENTLTDGDSYVLEDAASEEPSAALFSNDDLTINGTGSLTVNANFNNGIQSKDDLKISGGSLTVNAVNDGIKGKDSISVQDATITVNAGGDGMQSNNAEDAAKGFISIVSGALKIVAGEDGIQAQTTLTIADGDITIVSGGGSANSSSGNAWGAWGKGSQSSEADASASAKGLKAGVNLVVEGGAIRIDSSDDAMHSNDTLTINGGEIVIASGDDGIHADASVEINAGEISITKCYEAIESAIITLNDGQVHLVASDDGLNVVGGVDGSSVNGRPGQNSFASAGDTYLNINGGYLFVDAAGDGLDINGSINMTGGVVILNGPTNDGNGAVDYDRGFKMTGGLLVAVGSAGMAQAPDTSSTQYAAMITFPSALPARTLVHIASKDGEGILTFVPTKAYQSVVVSSAELKKGATYVVYTGGSASGTATDGLYVGGTYTAGTQSTSFTISSIVTGAGARVGGMGGGGRR